MLFSALALVGSWRAACALITSEPRLHEEGGHATESRQSRQSGTTHSREDHHTGGDAVACAFQSSPVQGPGLQPSTLTLKSSRPPRPGLCCDRSELTGLLQESGEELELSRKTLESSHCMRPKLCLCSLVFCHCFVLY
ncbi:rCG27628, isoform CRA_b [Rattus norvegicus]|uniref:RCG27628, isoform CRA_b n=1 Tax=Rattus norvegicus TaxID=10116 RepID=A6KBL8_RAT|nr:rCG27628, isoform CRA_b [Rattus norvegicus]